MWTVVEAARCVALVHSAQLLRIAHPKCVTSLKGRV